MLGDRQDIKGPHFGSVGYLFDVWAPAPATILVCPCMSTYLEAAMSDVQRWLWADQYDGLYPEPGTEGFPVSGTILVDAAAYDALARQLEAATIRLNRITGALADAGNVPTENSEEGIRQLTRQLAEAQQRLYRYDHWTPEHTIEEWLTERKTRLAEVAAAGENVVKMWSRMDDIQMNAAIVSFQAAVAKAQGERNEL